MQSDNQCIMVISTPTASNALKRCLSAFFVGFTILAMPACEKPQTSEPVKAGSEPAKRYAVQGLLRSINFADRSITVEHEDIPKFMPSMTMPFDVKTMAEVEPLKAGDAIEFTLIVTDETSWIEGVKKIAPSEIQLPVKGRKAIQDGDSTAKVERLKEGDPLPEFELIDSNGRTLNRQTFAGKPLLFTFIFTRCPIPQFCPLMTSHFGQIQETLGQSSPVRLLSISFDTEFDTPEILAAYAEAHTKDHDQWRFATGTPAQIARLTQSFSVSVQPENGTITHGLATVLVDANGVIRNIWRGNAWKPSEAVAAVRAL